jgi:selenocysteine lyase/cysteine desulfurase
MLYLDGVYNKRAVFYFAKPPTSQDLDEVAQKIAAWVSRYLEKAGYLIRDAESEYLDLYSDAEDAMSSIVGASISYRIAFGPNADKKLERVCRYITCPAIAEQRVSLTGHGNVVVELKSPYDDGTTHVILSPMEFIGRLVSLVPKPKGYGMSWAQTLKRVLTGRPSA